MVARTHARMFAVIATFAVTLSFLFSPVQARGPSTDQRGRTEISTFNATVQPHHDGGTTETPDCLIWDIDGANATASEPFGLHFEVEGRLEVRR